MARSRASGVESMEESLVRRGLLGLFVGALALTVASPAAAHTGTTHAGTPHWLLFALFVAGIAVVALGSLAVNRGVWSVRTGLLSVLVGAVGILFGGVGLVELQVVSRTPPTLVEYYPIASLVVAASLAVGGLLVTRLRWPEKPQYFLLSLLLAAWIVYPTVMPNQGYYHPLGYLVALGLPVTLGYVVWTDGRAVVQSLRHQRRPRVVGAVAGLLFAVFFAFSAGTMSFNPDQGVNMPTEAFVIPYDVASPLVVWPAIEWYVPSIPFSGYVSVGSLLLMGTLGGLVGLNAAVVVQQWTAAGSAPGKQTFTGTLAASGATACCCCAPAFYGAVSVVFGTAATPVYWSFMIPSSPVGGTFFAASVLLLVGSFVRAGGGPTKRDRVPRSPEARPIDEDV